MDNIAIAAEQFKQQGNVINIREYGNGNINSTFLVTLDSCQTGQENRRSIILQRINTKVFHRPELVMLNMRTVTEHVRRRLTNKRSREGRRWKLPNVLMAADGNYYWISADGSFWRALSFIDAAESLDIIRDINHAGEIGYALGMFHYLLSDLPDDKLADTLKGFHITPGYLSHYDEVFMKYKKSISPEVKYCMDFIRKRSAWAHVLENAKAQRELVPRTIHGDPKINNIMIDINSGMAVSIVDLDTVKPGLVHYDIGDCLRSGCNLLGEETERWEEVYFETDICRAILKGYSSMASEFLTENDYDYFYDAVRLLAFELGLRFFTDYLEGNVYFRTTGPNHNLARALVQFRLTESIENQANSIRTIIREMR